MKPFFRLPIAPGTLVWITRGSARIPQGTPGCLRTTEVMAMEAGEDGVRVKIVTPDPLARAGGQVGDTLVYPWSAVELPPKGRKNRGQPS